MLVIATCKWVTTAVCANEVLEQDKMHGVSIMQYSIMQSLETSWRTQIVAKRKWIARAMQAHAVVEQDEHIG